VRAELGDDLHDSEDRRAVDRGSVASRRVAIALAAVAVAPLAIGSVSLVGDTWHPVGDWASMLFRIGQVGSRDTPLVGTYTVKGWAHPGPFLYYAAAPLHRLTSGDPRSMAWSAAIVNAATVAAIAGVAWRRGRLALTMAVLLLVALLTHGLGPDLLVDLWNPYLGLLPFLLVLLLAWDAALGRPRSVLLAAVPATVAIQCHVSFAPLIAVVGLWLVAWCRWSARLVPVDGSGGSVVGVTRPEARWSAWRPAVVGGAVVAAVMSLPVLVDLVADTHNLASVGGHLVVGSGTQIGVVHGLGLVSRYTRPDGPWIGGAEPSAWGDVQGSGPVVALLVLAVLGACVVVARRRGLTDAVALATLTLTLVVASIPAAANLVTPLFPYLTQWLKIVGGLVWFTVVWTAWRLVETRLAAGARRAAGVAGAIAVLAAAAWSFGPATRVDPAAERESVAVQDLRAQLADRLDPDLTYRVEGVADSFGHNAAGLFFSLIADGFDVLTADGGAGLKWGHGHRWTEGEPYDVYLTVAVHYGGSWQDAYEECAGDPDVELVASYDRLSPAERARQEQLEDDGFYAPATLTDADRAEAERLERNGFRAGVFAGETGCSDRDPDALRRPGR
jgi:hypothetical protein